MFSQTVTEPLVGVCHHIELQSHNMMFGGAGCLLYQPGANNEVAAEWILHRGKLRQPAELETESGCLACEACLSFVKFSLKQNPLQILNSILPAHISGPYKYALNLKTLLWYIFIGIENVATQTDITVFKTIQRVNP